MAANKVYTCAIGLLPAKTYFLVTYTGAPEANEIGQLSLKAGEMAADAFNGAWQELADGKSHIYKATVKVSLGFAAMLLAFWAIPWFNTVINEGYSPRTINELIYPLLIVFMLAVNNGVLLSSTCLLFRSSANYLNKQILGETINGIVVEQAIRKVNMSQTFQEMLHSKVQQCNSVENDNKSDTNNLEDRTTCISSAIDLVKEEVRKYEEANKNKEGFKLPNVMEMLDSLKKTLTNTAEAVIQATVKDPIQKVLALIFMTMQMGFSFLVEISFLLNAYIAPIFLSLSLLPGQSKLVHVWLSGWLGLGLVKVSYTLIIGMATSSIVNAQGVDPLLLPLLEGVLSPILALAIASGGGMALFNGLSSAAAGTVRFVVGAISKLA